MSQNYSVLMSVYHKEKPEYLRESMESIYNQTIPTDNFVLVCDGPLNPPLDEVIAEMQEKFGHRLYVHRLAKNGGLGNALNEGMTYCRHELVVRMDSDDVSHNDRCEREIYIFENHPDVSIVSGVIEEFVGDISHIQSRRVVPQRQKDIIAFAKKRNPFNHPCVMYRKVLWKQQEDTRISIYWKTITSGFACCRRDLSGIISRLPSFGCGPVQICTNAGAGGNMCSLRFSCLSI
jgi:glycosyltransferase involved in cell wall biosynthesis